VTLNPIRKKTYIIIVVEVIVVTLILNLRWFKGFDWAKLRDRTMAAPLVRPVKNNMDRSNFDEYPRDRDEPADETSGWDFDF
jgi:hypothetical protein